LASAIGVAATMAASLAVAESATLADARLLRQLDARVAATWRGQTLGEAVGRLVEGQKIAAWVDRRVDKGAVVDLAIDDEPLGEALSRLAAAGSATAAPFRTVVYIGPESTARELATLSMRARESLQRAPAAMRARWLQATPWSFPRLSQPRPLVEGLARSIGVSVSGAERVPLDLWPAQALPNMSVLDRIVLILAGFDLTAEISADGRALRVASLERPVQIEREYAVPRGRRAAFDGVLDGSPEATVELRGGRTVVGARWEEHEQLREAIRAKGGARTTRRADEPSSQRTTQRQTFTLKIENQPVDRVMAQIAEKASLRVQWADAPPQGLAGLTTCDVREADLDELLAAILAPVGLRADREDRTVTIRAAGKVP